MEVIGVSSFTPARLTLARKRRGLNKTQLAKAVGVTPQSISDYEAGRRPPSPDTLARLSGSLRFPEAFFGGPEIDLPTTEAVSFRSLATMAASQSDAARAAGALAFELCEWIEARFALPDPCLPDLRGMPPEDAAASTRERFGLGQLPIRSMVHLLEKYGVRVFSLAQACRELDAFSLWRDNRPFCFLNTTKSVEHSRFDAAHELGHLVMHRHGAPNGRLAENEANAFASAFLMPRSSIISRVPRGSSIPQLVELKSNWNVSVAALAHRANKVGRISDWTYRGMCMSMNRLGYRTREPSPLTSRETSQVLNKVFAALRERGMSKADVAKELRIYNADLEALVFGLVITSVEGGGAPSPERGRTPTQLRLVRDR